MSINLIDHPELIWNVPAYLSLVQPELTDEIIQAAEQQLGVKLPAAYLNLLRFQNGGNLRFEAPDSMLNRIYGIGPRAPSITTAYVSEEWGEVSFEIDNLVPIDGGGHWNICLDYRKNKIEPQVTYVDMECDSQHMICLLYTSPSPRDQRGSRMPSSA